MRGSGPFQQAHGCPAPADSCVDDTRHKGKQDKGRYLAAMVGCQLGEIVEPAKHERQGEGDAKGDEPDFRVEAD